MYFITSSLTNVNLYSWLAAERITVRRADFVMTVALAVSECNDKEN